MKGLTIDRRQLTLHICLVFMQIYCHNVCALSISHPSTGKNNHSNQIKSPDNPNNLISSSTITTTTSQHVAPSSQTNKRYAKSNNEIGPDYRQKNRNGLQHLHQHRSPVASTAQQQIQYDNQYSIAKTNEDQSDLHHPTTNLPPLVMTTGALGEFNFAESGLNKQSQQKSKLQSNQRRSFNYANTNEMTPAAPPESASEDQESDSNPLPTVNNHSGSSSAISKAPQYVDVSNLRNTNVGSNFSSIQVSHHNVNSNNYNNMTTLSNNQLKPKVGLPECATQQVCNAIFVRMNYTQRLCECSGNYNWKCSNNLDPQDGHTIELTRKFDKRIYTQIKTCEPLREVRACKSPTDWTLLALQSERSGKAHYVVVCKCPTWAQLEGPYTHNHPPYANIPGIRVYGMLCAHQTARSSAQTYSSYNPSLSIYPEFPWSEALNVANQTNLLATLDSQ